MVDLTLDDDDSLNPASIPPHPRRPLKRTRLSSPPKPNCQSSKVLSPLVNPPRRILTPQKSICAVDSIVKDERELAFPPVTIPDSDLKMRSAEKRARTTPSTAALYFGRAVS